MNPRVTDVRGMFAAGSIAACRAGDIVALHFGTPAGSFVFHVSEKKFLRACRSAADSNLNPWRTLDQIHALERAGPFDGLRACGDDAQLAADAAATVPRVRPMPAFPRSAVARERLLPGQAADRCAQVFTRQLADLTLSAHDACQDAGLNPGTYTVWICRYHRGELDALRRAAGVSLRPARRPQNLATAAASGAPLLKPGGRL